MRQLLAARLPQNKKKQLENGAFDAVSTFTQPFWSGWWPLGRLKTHSSLQPLKQPTPCHSQTGEREQHVQQRCVLGQSPIAHLQVPELAIDSPNQAFHLGLDAGLNVFKLVDYGTLRAVLDQRTAFVRAHGHTLVCLDALGAISLGHILIDRVNEHGCFIIVVERTGLRDVINHGRRCDDSVHKASFGIHVNMGFHSEVPLAPVLGLVHLQVTLAVLVLGRTVRGNQGGVDLVQHLWCQLGLFEQVAKTQDADPVGNVLRAGEVCKLTAQRCLKHRLLHRQVRQTKQLWAVVNAQHGRQITLKKRGVCCANSDSNSAHSNTRFFSWSATT